MKVTLAAGLGLTAIAVLLTLLGSPLVVAHANGRNHEKFLAETSHGGTVCQPGEFLPRGTTAVRLSLSAAYGPAVHAVLYSHGRPITAGTRGSAWTSSAVTVGLNPLPRAVADVTVCASFRVRDELLTVYGESAPGALQAHIVGKQTLPGRMSVEYLRPGPSSWASLAPTIARHMGLGRAPSGALVWLLVLALSLAVVASACALVLKELR